MQKLIAIALALTLLTGVIAITTPNAFAKKELKCEGCTIKIEDSDVSITLTGLPGAQGEQGIQGIQGIPGQNATVTVVNGTLVPVDNGTETNSTG